VSSSPIDGSFYFAAPAVAAGPQVAIAPPPQQELAGTLRADHDFVPIKDAALLRELSERLVHDFGWRYVFFVMGLLGLVMGLIWVMTIHGPKDHPGVNAIEFDYIKQGGALVDMDAGQGTDSGPKWGHIKQLLGNRMMVGVYLGQYCINALTYFFLTWFPVYLVKERGLTILQAGFVATLPALCGFFGGELGGVISDAILRKTNSITLARKIPIVGGMLLSMSIIGCNYVDGQAFIVGLMALAFFGKGIGALGWAVVSDTSPKEAGGVSGGLFNMFGNLSSITTPIIVGYILSATGSFNGALVFIGANALVAAIAYLFVVGNIERVQLRPTTP
jgi:ACS family glucarate transporter-like MFS transporter